MSRKWGQHIWSSPAPLPSGAQAEGLAQQLLAHRAILRPVCARGSVLSTPRPPGSIDLIEEEQSGTTLILEVNERDRRIAPLQRRCAEARWQGALYANLLFFLGGVPGTCACGQMRTFRRSARSRPGAAIQVESPPRCWGKQLLPLERYCKDILDARASCAWLRRRRPYTIASTSFTPKIDFGVLDTQPLVVL